MLVLGMSNKLKKQSINKQDVFWIVPVVFLIIACFPIKGGEYYTLLRYIVCLCSAYYSYTFYTKNNLSFIIFVIIAIFYNPLLPIYLHEKGFWIPINMATILIFYSFNKPSNIKKIINQWNMPNINIEKIINYIRKFIWVPKLDFFKKQNAFIKLLITIYLILPFCTLFEEPDFSGFLIALLIYFIIYQLFIKRSINRNK